MPGRKDADIGDLFQRVVVVAFWKRISQRTFALLFCDVRWKSSAMLQTLSTMACAFSVRSATSAERAISNMVTAMSAMDSAPTAAMMMSLEAIERAANMLGNFLTINPLIAAGRARQISPVQACIRERC
jgi:hypothetical protein